MWRFRFAGCCCPVPGVYVNTRQSDLGVSTPGEPCNIAAERGSNTKMSNEEEDNAAEEQNENNIDDLLDSAEQLGGGGEYPEWWKPHKGDPDTLYGMVMDVREGDYGPIYTVRSAGGSSGFPRGEDRSTQAHAALVGKLEDGDVTPGDMVHLKYTGRYDTNAGNKAEGYDVNTVREEEWAESPHAESLRELQTRGNRDTDVEEMSL